MRKLSILLFTISLAAGCGQKASETQSSSDSTRAANDSSLLKKAEPPVDEKKEEKPELNAATLSKFNFATEGVNEYNFDVDGIITRSAPVDGEQTFGKWSLTGSVLQISFEADTAKFQVLSFHRGELNLRTSSEFGGKVFGEVEREGYYYIKLHRLIYSAPFSEEQITGGWQESNGGCSFGTDGTYNFGAPDCIIKGNWKFDSGYIGVDIIQSDCGSNVPTSINLEVLRLAPGLMITKDTQEAFDIFTRRVEY
ncbi:MAG TPA: hypothetical protein PLR06_10815 [Cyclobacteriaceae bacterium]|nr:hypothetical protein [Cyclobacteriaceae bacterium]